MRWLKWAGGALLVLLAVGGAYARLSDALARASLIVVTHEHPDHNPRTPERDAFTSPS